MLEEGSEPEEVQLGSQPRTERDPDVVAWERIGFTKHDAATDLGKRKRTRRSRRAASDHQDFGDFSYGHLVAQYWSAKKNLLT
jgi:hypothetical protein